MNLTDQQIDRVRQTITERTISREPMRDNLVDHLCCAVELRMSGGNDFEKALSESLRELAPNGLREIERETFLLLNFNFIVMKKITYITGLICCVCVSAGSIFKILHLTGANELMFFGLAGAVLLYLPLLLFGDKPKNVTPLQQLQTWLGLISLFLLSVGGILKIFHLVAANETLLLGAIVFSLGFLPVWFLKMYRESVAQ